MISLEKILKIIDLAKECSLCAMSHFKDLDNIEVNYKEDESPLTRADIEVNKLAVNGLKKYFQKLIL